MFSKVFRVEKKTRELAAPQRPASATDQRPPYYPLSASSLPEHRKRVTLHDTHAQALEHDLDLLELVCRSDSLHKRLDELQAKYERMDDGMENLTRGTHVKGLKSGKSNSGFFGSLRTSKSFEEPEAKKPSFFQRLFGNRLSKSEDDLLDKGGSSPTSSGIYDDPDDDLSDDDELPVTPPVRERRSASEDFLSTKQLLRRPTEKRQSWCAESSDVDLRQMPPPPPPPPPLPLRSLDAAGHKCGLKRKRVIRVYNLNPLDQKDPNMGSRESFSDSTDSEKEYRTRSSDATGRRANPLGSTAPPTPEPDLWHENRTPANREVVNGCKMESSAPASHRYPELLSHSGGTSRKFEGPPVLRQIPMGAVATSRGGDMTTEGVVRRRGDLPPGIGVKRQGRVDIDELDVIEDKSEARMAKDTTRKCPASVNDVETPETSPNVGTKSLTSPKVENRIKPNLTSPKIENRIKPSLTSPKVENRIKPSLTSPKVENRIKPNLTSPKVDNRIKPILKNPARSFESDITERPKTSGSSLTRTPSSKEVLLTRTPSPRESSPSKTTSSLDLPLSKTTSCQELSLSRTSGHQELSLYKAPSSQELPTRLPTTASIQELDHFLSAIIQNLESQLQSGGSLALKPRGGTMETKRKRKKRKEEEEEEQKIDVVEPKMEVGCIIPRRYKRMSECGACGRRWVEPRLLPCLHTVCTPCLHARAAHITPTPSTNHAHPSGSGKITPTPESRRASQDQVPLRGSPGPVSAGGSTATTAVLGSTAGFSTPVASFTASSSRQLNGEGSSSSTQASHSSLSSSNTSRDDSNSTSHSAQHPRLNENQEALPQENQQNQSSLQQLQQQQMTASTDLESVIELLTNLSPNSPNNNPAPKVTITPTPIINESLTKPTPVIPNEDDVLSPSSTLDSRCSSRTRSSGRSSSCESIQKSRGVWVVWCPECGYEAEIPSGGVECFPLNYVLQKQLVLEALNSSTTTVYCDLCHDDVVAEERCDTCPVNLCRLCSHAHTRQRRTAHHTVISLQEARTRGIREVAHTLVCATHGEGEVGWWCRECHEPLCAACLATLHRGHSAITVDQEAPQARRNLTALFDQASSRMNELLSTVEDLTGAATRVQQRGRVVSDQVNAFIDDYIMALEEHRHTLLRQVRQACERAQRGIVTESQRAGQTASWLRQGCDLTHDLLHHAGDAEVLALAHLVSCRLKSLLSEQVKSWTRWERLALLREHRAAKVRGHRIHGVIADTPADPANSRLKPLCDVTNLVVGTRATALVVARDVDGQPITHGGEEISATILTRDGTTLCGCSVRDREDGSYEVIFSPPVPAAAALHITIQSAHVQGSPLEITITSAPSGICSVASEDNNKEAISGRRHTGVFHCCTFCSSGGDKTATCACAATMPGGYQGCGHNHTGHPGQKHWSCCAQTNPSAPCTRPPSQYYQVTL